MGSAAKNKFEICFTVLHEYMKKEKEIGQIGLGERGGNLEIKIVSEI